MADKSPRVVVGETALCSYFTLRSKAKCHLSGPSLHCAPPTPHHSLPPATTAEEFQLFSSSQSLVLTVWQLSRGISTKSKLHSLIISLDSPDFHKCDLVSLLLAVDFLPGSNLQNVHFSFKQAKRYAQVQNSKNH